MSVDRPHGLPCSSSHDVVFSRLDVSTWCTTLDDICVEDKAPIGRRSSGFNVVIAQVRVVEIYIQS